jgi:hypothetical protein
MIACVSRGRADLALPPSGFAKIFGDKAVIPSRHCRGNERRSAARIGPPGGCRDFPAQRDGCYHAIGMVSPTSRFCETKLFNINKINRLLVTMRCKSDSIWTTTMYHK